jgi:hypothetical protein
MFTEQNMVFVVNGKRVDFSGRIRNLVKAERALEDVSLQQGTPPIRYHPPRK